MLFIYLFLYARSALLLRLFLSCGKRGLFSGYGGAAHCRGFSCGIWAVGRMGFGSAPWNSRAHAQYLWQRGFVAPWHMGSSQISSQTHVSSPQSASHPSACAVTIFVSSDENF